MNRFNYWLTVPLVFLLLQVACTSNSPNISEQHVARTIKYLSADSLKGRHAFSPEIERAAAYISSEFEAMGLTPVPGEDDFYQHFTIYSLTPDSVMITVNNQTIKNDYYFGVLNSETIDWQTGDVKVFRIGGSQNFREEFEKVTSDSIPALILVDKAHKNWFHRYRSWFAKRNRSFELNQKPNDVFVLHSSRASSYRVTFRNHLNSKELANIAGMIEGKHPEEIVLFSAHYDHIGRTATAGRDSIANGANDNASGVSGIIEIARHYSQQSQPQRSLYFVGFTAEEAGGYGSKYLAKSINPDNVVAMINLEMIGKPATEGTNYAWITGFEHSTLGQILQESIHDSSFVFFPDPYPTQNLFFRSDNAPFARLGVPAHTISTTPIDVDRDYHTVSDEFHTINIPHVAGTITAVAKACTPIIAGKQTPTRIIPDSLE